jgi:hypothetical protein
MIRERDPKPIYFRALLLRDSPFSVGFRVLNVPALLLATWRIAELTPIPDECLFVCLERPEQEQEQRP